MVMEIPRSGLLDLVWNRILFLALTAKRLYPTL